MDRDELTKWALANGWQLIEDALCLTKPTGAHDAIVRLVLKKTVVSLEIKKPSGKWEKINSANYSAFIPDDEDGVPRGIGLEAISGLTKLMRDNKDRLAFSKIDARPKGNHDDD